MTSQDFRPSGDDIVFSGIGMITSHGVGVKVNQDALSQPSNRTSIEDYKIKGFQPGPFLSDRKVVKVVSPRDVLGLVAFEECVKNANVRHEGMNPDRTGLYVGAPPSATTDNANYQEGIEATRDAKGRAHEVEFGNTFRSANPTTLLNGLPNNVLCYGSKTLDARGPNSNYTCLETSGHLSILGASRAMRLGRLDCAIAGGFSSHTDPVILTNMRRTGLLKKESISPYTVSPFTNDKSKVGTITADGAAFIALEKRSTLEARGGKGFGVLLSGGCASEGVWPIPENLTGGTLQELIQDTLKSGGVSSDDVAIVSASGSGLESMDRVERHAIESVFSGRKAMPVVVCTAPAWGNLMEAGGVADLAVMAHFCATGSVPEAVKIEFAKPSHTLESKSGQVGVSIRTSSLGEYTCLVVRFEGDALI